MCRLLLLLLFVFLSTSCASDGPGSAVRQHHARDAVPKAEPLSKRGNPDSYVVFGQRYFVLPTAKGYKERGIASWYGKKFHGRQTSNGERYNMYAMTAAHKTLPLPSYVRVTNLQNGRRVILRVNDRGPFVNSRIIDLSYSAAQKLDMVKSGTALVEVEVVEPGAGRRVRHVEPRYKEAQDWQDQSHLHSRIYIQIGAFSLRANAEKMLNRLLAANISNAQISDSNNQGAMLHRVRIGPLNTVLATDQTVNQLNGLGFADYQVVIE